MNEGEPSLAARAPRMLPPLTDLNRAFWTGGADGKLLILRCRECRWWVHPPVEHCPRCGGPLVPEAVSGGGTVFTFTVNHQQFHPDVPPPYVVAIVELDEQHDLRLPTNIVDADPESIHCGMRVTVRFEANGDLFLPLFAPVRITVR